MARSILKSSLHEALMLQANVTSHPGMLSVVLGMLVIRVEQDFSEQCGSAGMNNADFLGKQKDKALFDKKLIEVGVALTSLQNCSEKPPLSQGHVYILDQVQIIRLPELVRDLFESAGYEPVVEIHPLMRADGNFITTKNRYESIGKRSGISFTF